MKIIRMTYSFWFDRLYISKPFKVIKETEKCYYIDDTYRYLKSEVGEPIIKYCNDDPYVDLKMIDTDEETMKKVMASWFQDKIDKIMNGGKVK